MCAKKYAFSPDFAVAPGETIREVMENMGMTQRDFAMRLDISVQSLNRIFKGEQPITVETARNLERVTGTPATFWTNLESNYRLQLAKEKETRLFETHKEWLKNFPLKILKERGYIPQSTSVEENFEAVLRFFGVSNVTAWENTWAQPDAAARRSRSSCFEDNRYYAATWVRMGELAAHENSCGATDIKKFRESMPEICRLTREDPSVFLPRLHEICNASGVSLAIVKEFPRLKWFGATKWLGETAIIMLNIRRKREDTFWFSFFHEAGHVILHNKCCLRINDGTNEDIREQEANDFAKDVLFGKKHKYILSIKKAEDVIQLAEELGIAPGIVAGQYRFMTQKYTYFSSLIRSFEWVQEKG